MTFALATVSCSGDKNGEKKDGDQRGKPSSANNKQSSNNNVPEARATDIKIKTIGWNIEEYDPATNKRIVRIRFDFHPIRVSRYPIE